MIWRGETTGIGTVPHSSIEAALTYSFEHDLPFLPQLPGELMLGAPGAERAWPAFLEAVATRRPPVAKVQIVGPVTMSKHASAAVDLIAKALRSCEALARIGVQPMIFVDEPSLGDGPFDQLEAMLTTLKSAGAITGVHCCGTTSWPRVLAIPALDVLSFDAALSLDEVMPHSARFAQRGGTLAFGIDHRRALPAFPSVLLTASCGLAGRTIARAAHQLEVLRDQKRAG